MVVATENGRKLDWFDSPNDLIVPKYPFVRKGYSTEHLNGKGLQETSIANQIVVLLRQGYIKSIRDSVSAIEMQFMMQRVINFCMYILQTLTHLRLLVNILTGIMLGVLYVGGGNDGSRVLDNYNLMFAILIHHMMSTMMLTILTCK